MSRFKVLLALLGIVLLISLACGGNATPQKVGEAAVSATDQPTTAPAKAEKFKPGDVVQVGDLTMVVNKMTEPAGSDFVKPGAGHKFVVVDVTFENKGAKSETVSALLQMKLKDDSGQEYNIDYMASSLDKGKPPDGEITPGEKLKGQVGFEIPQTARGLEFVFDANLFGGGKVFVNLP